MKIGKYEITYCPDYFAPYRVEHESGKKICLTKEGVEKLLDKTFEDMNGTRLPEPKV